MSVGGGGELQTRAALPLGRTLAPIFNRRLGGPQSSKRRRLAHIIKKDRFKMAAVVGLSTSRSEYFVRKECMVFAWFK